MDIYLKKVSVTYMKNTPFEKKALDNINLHIPKGTITGIIGHTGSGKSTLIQLIAGLIHPSTGTVKIGEMDWKNKKALAELRKQVGIVFQYPEHQLFEETVEKDIAFGPSNYGFTEVERLEAVKEAMELVKLPYEKFAHRSPFELSGGQKRRVAIAGVIAFRPKILILDEPSAGLDPIGKKDIFKMITELHQKQNMTTIIVSHSMDEVANFADNLIVLNQGKVLLEGTPQKVFNRVDLLQENNLDIPEITKLIKLLNQKITPPIPLSCFSIDELEYYLSIRLKEKK
ncbi:energy-coupling factor transporter ATPase [Vulcanibacillus modesticaldus]|uniref:Energy-coupling factor transporter ATP-binding protein EcfA2 n=1 Tax=Vulcanibacillus modesticaldus TaxID=337097 RepID=A0A1D2YS33_9BACI|nr:energy-coupling factor transporter ATPase [Vulcanibacillus modesticaldus]OEF96448.1 energy-coupling factor transporter ATPase [Vulcanibacillus modesticaldus]